MPDKRFAAQYLKFLSRVKDDAGITPGQEFSSKLMETVEALVIILNKQGAIVDFNPVCERLSGYARGEVVGKTLEFLIPADELAGVNQALQKLLSSDLPVAHQNHWQSKSGRKFLINWSNTAVKDEHDQVNVIIATGIDVTEVKAREKRRMLLLQILSALTAAESLEETLCRSLKLIRDYTGCDAAGIRLRKGEDYPYVQAVGFTEQFLSEESTLCSYQGGSIERDESGTANLDCICGRVIRGDLDPSVTPLTSGGAFFTGSISELAAMLAKSKTSFNIRNHCGKLGYESVALIPLRSREETVGLLQLNDQSPGKFSNEDIDFLSMVGMSIGAAIIRFQAETAKKNSELLLNTMIQKAREGFFLAAQNGEMAIYNEAMERITGYTKEEINKHGWFYLLFPDEETRRLAVQKARLALSGKMDYLDVVITCKDDTKKPIAFSLTPLLIDEQTYNFCTFIDVSERYKGEGFF